MIQEIGQYFVNFFTWAENWTFPHIPGHISVLDTVLAIDVCASYRKAMGKNKHPWLQVLLSLIPIVRRDFPSRPHLPPLGVAPVPTTLATIYSIPS